MATDILLDPATNDLPTISRLGTGLDLIRQRIGMRVGLHKGEVLTDASLGLPWAVWLSTKAPPTAAILAGVRRAVEGVPGVLRVENMEAAFTPATRTLTVTGNVTTSQGVLQISVGATSAGNISFTAMVHRQQGVAP